MLYYNTILEKIPQLLRKWGVASSDIVSNNHAYQYLNVLVFDAKKDGTRFRIVIEFRVIREAGYKMVGYQESVVITCKLLFFMTNSKDITLSIRNETLGTKLEKLLGKKDLEVYDKEFDKAFLIEGNHNYAHAIVFDEKVRKLLLKNSVNFNVLTVEKEKVSYVIELHEFLFLEVQEPFYDLLDICWRVAKNVDKV